MKILKKQQCQVVNDKLRNNINLGFSKPNKRRMYNALFDRFHTSLRLSTTLITYLRAEMEYDYKT